MNSRDAATHDAAQREPCHPRQLFMHAVAQGIAWHAEYDKGLLTAGSPGAQQISANRERASTMTLAMDEVLTAGEVSRMTGIPVSTLHDWAAKRERGVESPGPRHCRLSSRHRRWMRADVADWLAASRF
jgi:predicted DNA-binding transcriptional regulator AlpA